VTTAALLTPTQWPSGVGGIYSTRRERSSRLRSVSSPAPAKVHLVAPRAFNDAKQIADRFKAQVPVIINLQGSDTELAKRLIDFCSGLTYALDGGMQRVGDKIFLLTPRNVEVSPRSPRDRARQVLQPGVKASRLRPRKTLPRQTRGLETGPMDVPSGTTH
jgi:SepF-like predicted cell division protein (DUF552 family)